MHHSCHRLLNLLTPKARHLPDWANGTSPSPLVCCIGGQQDWGIPGAVCKSLMILGHVADLIHSEAFPAICGVTNKQIRLCKSRDDALKVYRAAEKNGSVHIRPRVTVCHASCQCPSVDGRGGKCMLMCECLTATSSARAEDMTETDASA